MKFLYELYTYQKDILDVFEKELKRWDKKIHIVAPPGSGKTIVWLEMITRLNSNTLILVPNLTLQEQWKDKIKNCFLEPSENIDELVSFDPLVIKKINIITYQSLTQTGQENDEVTQEILDKWFKDFFDEFNSRLEFNDYVANLKDSNFSEYSELFSKYKKWVKKSSDNNMINNLLSTRVKDFFASLKANNVKTIVVDEAHHLTSWWSKVIFYLRNYLNNPYIIGLTATPPFDDVDFFDLNDDYANLLGEVDYYIPTPAIIKSGRLAPYSDLVYFVEPDDNLSELLTKKEKILEDFLILESKNIAFTVYKVLKKDYDKLLKNSPELLDSYLRFIYIHDKSLDISEYINENSTKPISLEDVAKATGKWLMGIKINNSSKTWEKPNEDKIKRIFFDLGYIWRANNFYRFQTPIEKLLIYSKTKINWVKEILKKEKTNLGDKMKCAIITDFLSAESDYINCEYIFDEIINDFSDLNPYLLSWQWIYKIWTSWARELVKNETILSITQKLTSGETKLVIGTRWILGEWWDCPKLNTLMDLTWMTAYMSVNQVRWRAIRLDLDNLKKCANIYDVVCLGSWLQWLRDYKRLEGKHEKFYWVNDAGIVVKWVDHVYPNLADHLDEFVKINENMLRRSQYRDTIYDYWGIWWEFSNKEVFGLHLEITRAFEYFPIIKIPFLSILKLRNLFKNEIKLKEIANSYYFTLIFRFLDNFIEAIVRALKANLVLPQDFDYELKRDSYGNIQVISKYKDEFISKWFIVYISTIFSPITNQKYVMAMPMAYYKDNTIQQANIILPLPEALSKNKEFRDNFTDFLAPFDKSVSSRNKKRSIEKRLKILVYIFIFSIFWPAIDALFFPKLNDNFLSPFIMLLPMWIFVISLSLLLVYNLLKILLKLPISFINRLLNIEYFNYYFITNSNVLRKDIQFINLNAHEPQMKVISNDKIFADWEIIDIKKKDFIGKSTFITSKIEKLWI